jgi:hypothetical protein
MEDLKSCVGTKALNSSFLAVELMMHQGSVVLFCISRVIPVEKASHSFVTDKVILRVQQLSSLQLNMNLIFWKAVAVIWHLRNLYCCCSLNYLKY